MQATKTRPTHILRQIDNAGEPPKFIRCPSCLQVKTADFVDISTGKEYCGRCAHRFKEKSTAILFFSETKSIQVATSEGEIKRISPEQKAFLDAMDDIKIRYKVHYIQLAAHKIGKTAQWGNETLKLLKDEGFYIPGRAERRAMLVEYIIERVRVERERQPHSKIIAAIAQETGCNIRALRPLVKSLMINPSHESITIGMSLTRKVIDVLMQGKSLSVTELQAQIGLFVPRSSIKSACIRLNSKGVVSVTKQGKFCYYKLS